ncbi:unnamed protein product [Closterium sp. Yama58-4]|nr:unnamed protein product [Closterium sp. Yama58-4]
MSHASTILGGTRACATDGDPRIDATLEPAPIVPSKRPATSSAPQVTDETYLNFLAWMSHQAIKPAPTMPPATAVTEAPAAPPTQAGEANAGATGVVQDGEAIAIPNTASQTPFTPGASVIPVKARTATLHPRVESGVLLEAQLEDLNNTLQISRQREQELQDENDNKDLELEHLRTVVEEQRQRIDALENRSVTVAAPPQIAAQSGTVIQGPVLLFDINKLDVIGGVVQLSTKLTDELQIKKFTGDSIHWLTTVAPGSYMSFYPDWQELQHTVAMKYLEDGVSNDEFYYAVSRNCPYGSIWHCGEDERPFSNLGWIMAVCKAFGGVKATTWNIKLVAAAYVCYVVEWPMANAKGTKIPAMSGNELLNTQNMQRKISEIISWLKVWYQRDPSIWNPAHPAGFSMCKAVKIEIEGFERQFFPDGVPA